MSAQGMAAQVLAAEIVAALLADEKDGGYDLTAGLFGPNFSTLVRRWAALELGRERLTTERDQARTSYERTVAILVAVHSTIGPTLPEGVDLTPDFAVELLKRLSAEVRALPEKLDALAAELAPVPVDAKTLVLEWAVENDIGRGTVPYWAPAAYMASGPTLEKLVKAAQGVKP